jgi:hypothetical protein
MNGQLHQPEQLDWRRLVYNLPQVLCHRIRLLLLELRLAIRDRDLHLQLQLIPVLPCWSHWFSHIANRSARTR